MTIYVNTDTGAPMFVLGQMMQIESLRVVYKKYGIHGIYYAVLFGWAGSPFATLTKDSLRDENVCREVYGSTYYDPNTKELVTMENYQVKDQYLQDDMRLAIKTINELARVPIIEERNLYLKLLDRNKEDLEREAHPQDTKGKIDIEANKVKLITNRQTMNKMLEEVQKKEKEILLRSDSKASLSDFISKISPDFLK